MKTRCLVLCLALSTGPAHAGSPGPAPSAPSKDAAEQAPPAETCPRSLIHGLLAMATEQNDIVSALGLERETLRLCRDRQQIVAEIHRLEGELRSLQAVSEPAPPARIELPEESVRPDWSWFSIIGGPGHLQAGLTDGRGIWFVREGDDLPHSVRVRTISARPPGVRLSSGAVPYRPVPVQK